MRGWGVGGAGRGRRGGWGAERAWRCRRCRRWARGCHRGRGRRSGRGRRPPEPGGHRLGRLLQQQLALLLAGADGQPARRHGRRGDRGAAEGGDLPAHGGPLQDVQRLLLGGQRAGRAGRGGRGRRGGGSGRSSRCCRSCSRADPAQRGAGGCGGGMAWVGAAGRRAPGVGAGGGRVAPQPPDRARRANRAAQHRARTCGEPAWRGWREPAAAGGRKRKVGFALEVVRCRRELVCYELDVRVAHQQRLSRASSNRLPDVLCCFPSLALSFLPARKGRRVFARAGRPGSHGMNGRSRVSTASGPALEQPGKRSRLPKNSAPAPSAIPCRGCRPSAIPCSSPAHTPPSAPAQPTPAAHLPPSLPTPPAGGPARPDRRYNIPWRRWTC